jgi:hypothetical protein
LREPPDFRDLVGEDLPPEELARLRRVDALLRRVPAPPHEVPHHLTQVVASLPHERRMWTRPRLALALAIAAAVAALSFGLGRWTDGEEFDTRIAIPFEATEEARGATAVVEVGGRDDASGNQKLRLTVSGLRPLRGDARYYVLWLEKDGEYAATCGTFDVSEDETSVDMTVSYSLADYDAWVISEHGEATPPLLRAKIGS